MNCVVQYKGEEIPKDKFIKDLISHLDLTDEQKKANEHYLKSINYESFQEQETGKMGVRQQEAVGEGVGGQNRPEKTAGQSKETQPKEKVKPSEVAKTIATKIRSLKTAKGNTYGGLQGVGAAIYDGALETAATVIEQGGKLADAIQAAIDHIKANSKEKDEKKIRDAITLDLAKAGVEDRYEEPEMVEANNAYVHAKVEGKFGTDALDHIIGQLQDTDLKNIVDKVKAKITQKPTYLEDTRKRILERQAGSEEDQAALLMDEYHLKGQEENLIKSINKSTDPKEILEQQKQLAKVKSDRLDNALANTLIGRQASSMFRLRQVAIDQDANLLNMRESYMASRGIKKLSAEQEEEINKAYDKIREAEIEVKQLKEKEKATREANEKLQQENDALKKIINDAKAKHDKSNQTTQDRLTVIRKNIDNSKKELGKIFSANAFLNPEVYKHLKNIAVGKAEEIYVKTRSAIELNHLVKSVLDEIKDVAPHITEDDVRDAIAGRNNVAKPRLKTELQKNVQDLKRQAKILSDYQQMIDGKLSDNPEVRKLQEERKADPDLDTKAWNVRKYKAIQKQIKDVEDKLNRGEFTTPAKEAKKFEKSPELKDAEHKLAVRKFQWLKGNQRALMENEPWYKRWSNNILQWQRFSVLSYPSTVLKLAAVATKGLIAKPFQLAFQELNYRIMHAVGQATGRTGASGMIYGKVRPEAMAKFYGELIRTFSAQNFKAAFSGMDDADVLYGKSKYMEDYDMGSGFHNAFLETPGRTHGYIKQFLRKPETAFAHNQLMQSYIEKSADIDKKLKDPGLTDKERKDLEDQQKLYDVTNDETRERINALAAEHGKWSILMNKNHAVEKFRTLFSSLTGDKQPSLVTKAFGYLLKTETPILKIPVNYARRYFLMKYGMIKAVTGSGEFPGLLSIAIKGTDKLTDQNKELLSRTMTYGSMGAASFAAGYMLRNHIQKNDDGSIEVDGHHVPKLMLDSPLDESFMAGAITGQHNDDADEQNAYNWIKNFVESDIDVGKKMPFTNQLQYGFLSKFAQSLFQKSDDAVNKQMAKALNKKIADMITPGFLKEWAASQQGDDKPKPDDLLGTLESGVPYAWKFADDDYSPIKRR